MTYTEMLEYNDFVLRLSQEHKTIFVKALLYMANIDGKRDENEIQYIKKAILAYKLRDIQAMFQPTTEEELLEELQTFDDRRTCLELIKELCLLGHADGDLSDQETLFIGHAGLAMGIDLEKIEEISNWTIDKIIWLEQGKIIFEDQ